MCSVLAQPSTAALVLTKASHSITRPLYLVPIALSGSKQFTTILLNEWLTHARRMVPPLRDQTFLGTLISSTFKLTPDSVIFPTFHTLLLRSHLGTLNREGVLGQLPHSSLGNTHHQRKRRAPLFLLKHIYSLGDCFSGRCGVPNSDPTTKRQDRKSVV